MEKKIAASRLLLAAILQLKDCGVCWSIGLSKAYPAATRGQGDKMSCTCFKASLEDWVLSVREC